MIKSLRVQDHESHVDSAFEFHPGLNVIHGTSNVGKSSALRALELVAYNEWPGGEDKKADKHGPVRVGAKNCTITVVTDRGTVVVKRGTGVNEWTTVTDSGTNNFVSPGQSQLNEVAEIMGLAVREIAGVKLRLNWASQRDRHFILDEIEGQSASPSLVAAVLDEIAGLSGCETLIRDLASDRLSHEQDVQKARGELTDLSAQLTVYASLDTKLKAANDANEKLTELKTAETKIAQLRSLADSRTKLIAKAKLLSDKLAKCVDVTKTDSVLLKLQQHADLVKTQNTLLSSRNTVLTTIASVKKRKLVDVLKCDRRLSAIQQASDTMRTLRSHVASRNILINNMSNLTAGVFRANSEEKTAADELSELISNTDTCPLLKKAWAPGCKTSLET
jgi:DNA repair exonuclease SbcCD ATPase subunit